VAQLPPDGEWLIQQIGGQVILFNRYTEAEIVRFDPHDVNAAAQAQADIHMVPELNDEQRCFAHFWSGYFYALAILESQSTSSMLTFDDGQGQRTRWNNLHD